MTYVTIFYTHQKIVFSLIQANFSSIGFHHYCVCTYVQCFEYTVCMYNQKLRPCVEKV
jgi:hypothetical protein